MKKIIFLPLAICIFLVQDALAAPAEAVFSTSFKDRIQVVIDGQLVNRTPARNVYIKGRPGMHRVNIHVFNRWGRLKFTHTDRIHFHPHSQHQYLLKIDPFRGSHLIQNTRPQAPVYSRRKSPPPREYPRHSRLRLLSDHDFFLLQDRMKDQRDDQNRMSIAKRALKNNLLSAEDVKELIYLFRFEDSRLAFAKMAYAHTSDPENYSLVFEAFRHPSSVQHLEAFIRRR